MVDYLNQVLQISRLGILIPVLLISARGNVSAQEGTYGLSWTNNYYRVEAYGKEQKKIPYLHFEGAVYEGDLVPHYTTSIPLNDNSKEYFLKDIRYERVPDSLLGELESPILLTEEKPQLHVYSAGRVNYRLDIRIPALRKNKETGDYERLMHFNVTSAPRKTGGPAQKAIHAAQEVNNSLLGSGFWYKFKVRQTGIYKLEYSDLQEIGLSNPANVRVFGMGGRQLSYWNSDPRPQDLPEIPIYMNKGSDGTFNEGDYILFYAEGPVTWSYDTTDNLYRQKVHGYSSAIFYFLTDSHGPAQEVREVDYSGQTANVNVSEYDDYACYEREWYNLIGSGRVWYSSRIDIDAFDTTFTFPNLTSGNPVRIEAKMAGRSNGVRAGHLSVNNQIVSTQQFSVMDFSRSYNTYASNLVFIHDFTATDTQIPVGASYDKVDQTDEAYLDYITINARSQLNFTGNATYFRDISSVGSGNIARYTISNANSAARVWDITDINAIVSLKGSLNGDALAFTAPADSLRQYVILDPGADFPKPVIDNAEYEVGEVANQNLRSWPVVDYIIVVPYVFREQAERLADFHRNENNLQVQLVSPQEIYNEFSSGTPDVSALRDFFRQQYKKGDEQKRLRFVLLFGDGSFCNHMNKEGNTNYILTYQSAQSMTPTNSYTSDDFFGMLDDDEGETNGKLDIGIGRLPVKEVKGTDAEAKGVVDKILNYYSSEYSDWRRRLCFVGDDGYDPGGFAEGPSHMNHANEVANHVQNLYDGFEVKKVYLDAYPQVSSATGDSYPDVNAEIQNLFERGILIFSYFGHGSENQITGEIILQKSDLQSMTNKSVLPLFITATCQFSRYDHVEIEVDNNYRISALTSAGESGILNPDGGAVALLSTSRVVFSGKNTTLVKNVFTYLFQKTDKGVPYTLGEVISMAKNDIGIEVNKLNFTLLGDPAMMLNHPRYRVCTDSINGIPVASGSDTLKAFGHVTVSGHVAYDDSTTIENFNGYVYPNVYDKKVLVTTFGNDDQIPFTYADQKNLLYKGKATVTNGRFTFSFVVPKDIAYNIDKGKISYYAENGVVDAKGEFRDVFIGGTDENAVPDNSGPQIDLYMNDNRFEDGGMTDPNPHIYAEVSDENGINTTGVGIGHDIVAVLDDSYNKPYVLNDYYEASVDDYTRGIIYYPLKDLEDGEHYLDLKVWDVFNNSSEATISFLVMSVDDLLLDQVVSYPNPATEYTEFVYTHNSPGAEHEVVLEVYDLMGRLVTRKEFTRYEGGYVSQPVHWDLTNNLGADVGAGVYVYRIKVTTPLGTSFLNQKLIIIR